MKRGKTAAWLRPPTQTLSSTVEEKAVPAVAMNNKTHFLAVNESISASYSEEDEDELRVFDP